MNMDWLKNKSNVVEQKTSAPYRGRASPTPNSVRPIAVPPLSEKEEYQGVPEVAFWECLAAANFDKKQADNALQTKLAEMKEKYEDAWKEEWEKESSASEHGVEWHRAKAKEGNGVVGRLSSNKKALEAFKTATAVGLANLTEAAVAKYDTNNKVPHLGSGMLMTHFTYLSLRGLLTGENELKPPEYFGLKLVTGPRRGPSLHDALRAGAVAIDKASATSFGTDCLELVLVNTTSEDASYTIQRGTVFQQMEWQHRQNLCLMHDYTMKVPANGTLVQTLSAFCMNLSCACANESPMALTDFYLDDEAVLSSQGKVWDHFEGKFRGDSPSA